MEIGLGLAAGRQTTRAGPLRLGGGPRRHICRCDRGGSFARDRMTSTPVARDTAEGRFIRTVEWAIGVSMTLAVIVARPREGGPQVFFEMANKVARGLVPYRDFVLEYPPMALVPLTVPRLLGGHIESAYQVPF